MDKRLSTVSPSNSWSNSGSKHVDIIDDKHVLPEIHQEKGKNNSQTDFIPEELLFALTQPPQLPQEKLGPLPRNRNLETSLAAPRKPAANVWNSKRREKFKHLTENTPCLCGAGKDISFLYDVPKPDPKTDNRDDRYDPSAIRKTENEREVVPMVLPDTLIPEEYHIVKNKGVLGLEYHEDNFATKPQDHEKHLVMFPSMNPTSRYEVIQLQNTLLTMLERIGIDELSDDVKGPTQMHNLLELIKKEQNIYNVIFHELIRQSSVECVERGKLLSELRTRYSDLLNRVPKQIKGLHEEVMAQRALDRRLTEELMRFKSTIGLLTNELSDVKQHDQEVTQEAKKTQQDLMIALSESQKNAGLLEEYHDLYELQRSRLEKQSMMLAEEREVWSTVAYSLALKVMDEHFVTTAKRLHVSEKAWFKLGTHFTVLLSDQDTEVLAKLQTFVDKWRELIDDFSRNLCQREEDMRDQLKVIRVSINSWTRDFQRTVLTKDGQLQKVPDKKKTTNLYNDIKQWQDVLNNENEKFGGDILLSGQECLKGIHKLMDGWTECALKVFSRHKTEEGENYPDHNAMLTMNDEVELLLKQFQVRLSGENGSATLLIHLSNALEMWDTKLNTLLHGSNPLPDQEWMRFYQLLDVWVQNIDDTLAIVGSPRKEDHRKKKTPEKCVELLDVMKQTQKWIASTINGIDSEDAKLGEQVGSLHTGMVKWMVQMLLRLAPDREGHSQEAKDAVLLGSATVNKLQQDATSMCKRLTTFSYYVTRCCVTIVADLTQEKVALHAEDPDREQKDLKQLQRECDDWVYTAQLMLCELTGDPYPEPPKRQETDMSKSETDLTKTEPGTARDVDTLQKLEGEKETSAPEKSDDMKPTGEQATDGTPPQGAAAEAAKGPKSADKPRSPNAETLEILGVDGNTHTKVIDQLANEPPGDVNPNLGSNRINRERAGTPNAAKAYEALGSLDILQKQLLSTEERAQEAEDRATTAETELKLAQETVRTLEKRLTAFSGQNEPEEEKKTVVIVPPPEEPSKTAGTTGSAKTSKSEKGSAKEKSRSSSRASNKSKKK